MTLEQQSCLNILDHLHDGLYLVDPNREITYWNRSAERISGFTAREVLGRSCADNILTHVDADGNSLCLGLCPLAHTMADGQPREAEVYLHHKDGHRVPVSVRVTALTDANGRITGGVEIFSEISHRAATELRIRELEKLALIDPLTQLANRRYIEQELEKRLEEQKRYQVPFGIFFIDIDHFKQFNDTYGHDAGDAVLRAVAGTLDASSRPFDLYGRWGGEEFIGVIRSIGAEDLRRLGDRVRALVENTYVLHHDRRLSVTISIGATPVRDDDTVNSLVRRADQLLYQSKTAGRNRVTME